MLLRSRNEAIVMMVNCSAPSLTVSVLHTAMLLINSVNDTFPAKF